MKKRVVILLLICSFVLCIALPFASKSYADPFTAGQIASTAYAMMESWGIEFTAGTATASGMNSFMSDQIESYVNSRGGSIADVFIGNIAVDVAGKLVVGQQMYNSIIGFVDWLKDKYDLSSADFSLSDGYYDGKFIPYEGESGTEITGVGIEVQFSDWIDPTGSQVEGGYLYYQAFNNGAGFGKLGPLSNYRFTGNWQLLKGQNSLYVVPEQVYIFTGNKIYSGRTTTVATVSGMPNTLTWNGANYVEPTVLNPDKEWTGTIGGYSTPDTNLDQLLGNIDQAVADNNLVVDGEVVDVPVPPGPVPTWTPVDDVIGGINGLGEELNGIGNDIGDISGHLDDIGDQIGDVTDALGGVQQGIQTQTGVISGAMDQAAQDVVDAIGSQTAALDESLTETAEGIQDIADILTAPEIDTPKFDLRELFPFCIPFDIYHLLQKFDGTPTAPHVEIPIVIPSIGFSYTLDLDFSAWDPVAAAMRTAELIVYALGLAWATSKVIKW